MQSEPEDILASLGATVDTFIFRAKEEFNPRWRAWPLDLSRSDFHEVIGALTARQVTLAMQLARSISIWNDHLAPIVLRTMADTYITLVWIFRDPVSRPGKFIHYGLGQLKLQLEHRKADMIGRKPAEGEQEAIEATEQWINEQRLMFLTEVDLGSWSGTTTRQMAEEADCLDFYNYVYTPFSACTHSMWHHIARYNLARCVNPLHRFHSVPVAVDDPPVDLQMLYLAGKYLQKTFAAFDKETGVSIPGPSAFDLLCKGLRDPEEPASDTPDPRS